LKDIRIKNIYDKYIYTSFKEKFRKLTAGDTAVFMEQHLCSMRQLCAGIADKEAFFDAEELLYSPGIAE